MRETDSTSPGSPTAAPAEGIDLEALEEALTVAAAAPGRRRLERLELLLLVRATQATRS